MTDQEFNAWADNFLDGLEFAKDQLGISTGQNSERNEFNTRATRRDHGNGGNFGRVQNLPRGHAGGVGAVYVGALQTTGNGTGPSVGGRQPKAFKVKRFNTRLRVRACMSKAIGGVGRVIESSCNSSSSGDCEDETSSLVRGRTSRKVAMTHRDNINRRVPVRWEMSLQ